MPEKLSEYQKGRLLRNLEFFSGLLFEMAENGRTCKLEVKLDKGEPNGFRMEENFDAKTKLAELLKDLSGNIIIFNQNGKVAGFRREQNHRAIE